MIRFDLTAPLQGIASAFDSLQTYVYGMAFLLTLIGYYAQVWRRRAEPMKSLEAMGLIALSVVFAASVPFWRPYIVNLFYYPAQALAEANSVFALNTALNNFLKGMADLTGQAANGSSGASTVQQAAQFVWNFGGITKAALLGLAVQAIVQVLSILGAVLALPFYFLQQVLVAVFFGFMPIAVSALTVPVLRDRAVAYMSMTASVLAWPLGFSIVAAATNIVFSVPFDTGGSVVGGVVSVLEPVLRELVAGIIMVFGTVMVPPTMFFIATQGSAQIDPIMAAARSFPTLGSMAKV